jgi:phage head maturation protease
MSDFLLIEASGDAKPKVVGMAYSGGKMKLPGWKHPVIVELAGMEIPDSVPLLTNHQNKTTSRVGMVTATVEDNTLKINGEIVSESDDAQDIVDQSKAGADWQLSIGADVAECELVKTGSREVNGQNFNAPFYHVKKSVLREVSVVAVGADAKTTMKVSASFKLNASEGGNMPQENNQEVEDKKVTTEEENKEQEKETKTTVAETETKPAAKPEAEKEEDENSETETKAGAVPSMIQASAQEAAQTAVKAERDRVSAIQAICDGDFPEIEREAISAGWTPEVVTSKVLATMRAERPSADVNISVKTQPEGGEMRKTIEAAMCLRVGLDADSLEKSYGAQVVEAGMSEMDMPLRQMIVECMKLDGIPYSRGFDNETIRAAFSSVSLPGILSNVANKKLLQSYKAQPVIATRLCSTGDLNDFKENDRFRLTDVGDLLPVAADGEIKDGGVVEEAAKNQLDTYGKKFCLTRKMIINDDLGAFMKVPTAMGNRAARLIDQLFFSRLLSNPLQLDGNSLFHASHKNTFGGATSALSPDSLKKAIGLFLDQVDSDGQPISVEPRFLLVPTALKHLAIELTRGATLVMAGGNDTTVRPALNVLADENLEVVSSPYLGNTAYTGNSQNAWYLFGDPNTVDTWEIGYLKGKRTPTVERGETDFNTLGLWFRVYFDLGVREQDHRGMVKANGA